MVVARPGASVIIVLREDTATRPDRWSANLPRLLDPERARALLQDACAATGWSVHAVLEAEVVKELSGRRRTLRYRLLGERSDGPREYRWFAKHYRGTKGERVWQVMRFVHDQVSADVMTAEPIGYLPKLRLLVTGELEGATLAQSLRGTPEEDIEAGLKRAGRAIASMHRFAGGPEAVKRHGPREEIVVLGLARARAGRSMLEPTFLHRFQTQCEGVEGELRRGVGPTFQRALLHRDLHPAQIVLREDAIGLIDLDDAARGEPELDLGNLEAHLLLEDLQWGGEIGPASFRAEALRRGYRACGEFDPERLQTYTRSALLRLATLERLADPVHC